MITGVFGLPGVGKSTFLAYCADCANKQKDITIGHLFWKTCLNSVKKYDRVYCNFPIKGTYKLNIDDLGNKQFENCLILIDEIMLVFDCRDWKTFSEKVKTFMALHRHYNIDIIWCSQSYKDCDIKIRNLTQQYCLMKKIGGHTKITPIFSYQRLQMGQISEGYDPAAPLGCSLIRRSRYYHLFDSFAAPEFPAVSSELWPFPDDPPVRHDPKLLRIFEFVRGKMGKLRFPHSRPPKGKSIPEKEPPLEMQSEANEGYSPQADNCP